MGSSQFYENKFSRWFVGQPILLANTYMRSVNAIGASIAACHRCMHAIGACHRLVGIPSLSSDKDRKTEGLLCANCMQ